MCWFRVFTVEGATLAVSRRCRGCRIFWKESFGDRPYLHGCRGIKRKEGRERAGGGGRGKMGWEGGGGGVCGMPKRLADDLAVSGAVLQGNVVDADVGEDRETERIDSEGAHQGV